MSEDPVNTIDMDLGMRGNGPSVTALQKVHEIRTPGVFRFLPCYDISQNQDCVVRVYYSLPDCSAISVGKEDDLKSLNTRISAIGQEIRRLKEHLDELTLCRDTLATGSSVDALQTKSSWLLDNVMRFSFVDTLRPLCLTLEVTYVDAVKSAPSTSTEPNTTVDFVKLAAAPEPISSTTDLSSEVNLPVGTKRKRDSEPGSETPVISSVQKNQIQHQALKRVRKKHRVDVSQKTEGDADMELCPPLRLNLVAKDDELETVFESLQLRVEEGATDEPMQVEGSDAKVLQADPLAWDDLEADEVDDPLMVTEYATEILEYMKEAERATMPNPNYIDNQTEINWKHRAILVDWLIQVHHSFKGNPETIYLCVNLLDRYLSKQNVSISKLQILGAVAYHVAAKYEEVFQPSRQQMMTLLQNCDTSNEELTRGERVFLKTLDWNLSAPGPMTWLRRGSKADDYDLQSRTIAKYLMEIGCVEHRLLRFVPSLVAAASLWLARLSLGQTEWTANLVHYTTYTEKELLSVAQILLENVLQYPVQFGYAYKEYTKRRRLRVSIYVKEWALTHWEKNAKVDLERDLLPIKAGTLKPKDLSTEKGDTAMQGVVSQESWGGPTADDADCFPQGSTLLLVTS